MFIISNKPYDVLHALYVAYCGVTGLSYDMVMRLEPVFSSSASVMQKNVHCVDRVNT
jgi:hypothetical protein